MIKRITILLFLLLLSSVVYGQRVFVMIDVHELLNLDDPKFEMMVKARELVRAPWDPLQVVMVADTVHIWIQHFSPNGQLSPQAENADVIITCYPEFITPRLRARHVMAHASGLIYLFQLSQYLYVDDHMDFSLLALASYTKWARQDYSP